MHPPRYVRPESELIAAKTWACPHCEAVGQLNRHGALRGLSPDGASKRAVRGQRWFCSNRGRRRGCGRTVSVLFVTVLKRATVRTRPFWQFVLARRDGKSVAAAWARFGRGFSLEAAYGWSRRWQRGQSALRTHFARGRDPPNRALEALMASTYGAADPIAEFQAREQQAWP